MHNCSSDCQEDGKAATDGSHEIDGILDTRRLVILVMVEPGEYQEDLTAGVCKYCRGSGSRSQRDLSELLKCDEVFSSL